MTISDMICDSHGLSVFYVEPGNTSKLDDDGQPLASGYYYAVTENDGIIYGPCGPYPLRKPAVLAMLAELDLDVD